MGDVRKGLAERIRDARQRLSMNQTDLAKEAGLGSAQIISQIENQERDVKAFELFNLAKALRLSISDLLVEEPLAALAPVLWRKAPETKSKAILEADFLQHCREYDMLERLCDERAGKELPIAAAMPEQMSFARAGQFAGEVAAHLALGTRPASCLQGILEEQFGVKVWYKRLGEDGSGASTKGDFGPAVLINADEPPWRRNYSLAHELFHLLTWANADEALAAEVQFPERVERVAEVFAASLLLPEEAVKDALERRGLGKNFGYLDLVQVAREFDVSTLALLWRLVNLGWLSEDKVGKIREDPKFKNLDRASRIGTWGMPPSLPERFVRLAFLAYQNGKLSRPRLAELLETSLVDLSERLMEYGLDDSQDYEASVRTVGR